MSDDGGHTWIRTNRGQIVCRHCQQVWWPDQKKPTEDCREVRATPTRGGRQKRAQLQELPAQYNGAGFSPGSRGRGATS